VGSSAKGFMVPEARIHFGTNCHTVAAFLVQLGLLIVNMQAHLAALPSDCYARC